jgi:predicted Zn-ribbon and HTH transcriptional regulator
MSEEATPRQRIAEALREQALTASRLSERVGQPASVVYDHLDHVARSVDGDDTDEQFLVAPPECGDCGFSDFDDPVNYPSRCPECKSENVEEPLFTID